MQNLQIFFAYKVDSKNSLVTFMFTPVEFSLDFSKIKNVTVKGSFTGWKNLENFKMTVTTLREAFGTLKAVHITRKNRKLLSSAALYLDTPVFTLTKKTSEVNIPGNTGFPEFKFEVVFKDNTIIEPSLSSLAKKSKTPCIMTNMLLITQKLNHSQKKHLKKTIKQTSRAEPLASFNLKKQSERDLIANTRRVPGTKNLYRGYHPYKKSRPEFDTEDTRINLVNEYLKAHKIQSLITLCGNEALDPSIGETVSPYVQSIQQKNNQCFIDTSYETVYFNSPSAEYGETVAQIVRFILNHPSPYYIHCRLGSDRTGTMSSILASLCGATWEQIANDYEKTSNMGIMEVRNAELLAYSFKHMLGEHPKNISNLKEAVRNHFINGGYLTPEELDELSFKLCLDETAKN